MKLHISDTDKEVIEDAARFIVKTANKSVKSKGQFSWALSGGSSPKRLFELLTTPQFKDEFPWADTYFFFGDERNVPHHSDESNFRMARLAMLDPMNIHENRIFAVDTSVDPQAAATAYDRTIRGFFGNDKASFSLILLGLGDDAHTASLFPGTEILGNDKDLVASVYLPDKDVYRISFTKTLINQAQTVAFLAFGANKADAVSNVFGKSNDYQQYPAKLINPKSGDLHWFLDSSAVKKTEINL